MRRVAILVDTSTGWGRRLIRGAISYARHHGPWNLWIDDCGQNEPLKLPRRWEGDGIIARVATTADARHVVGPGVPVVNGSGIRLKGVDFPRVTTDVQTGARLAADHFFDRGFRHFAYYGPQHMSYVEEHRQAFVDALAQRGFTCDVYQPSGRLRTSKNWSLLQDDLARWLVRLPNMVGVLTWANKGGREVIYACQRIGLLVPEHVAVLGGDDDDLLCFACSPPLSCTLVASEQIGYAGASLLDRLMSGKKPPALEVRVPPTGIVTRQSTDILAINDPELAQAVRFIREHASQPILVKDLLAELAISRRQLERRFREVLGRTPAMEIRLAHLQRAKELLAQTDWPIPRVAAASGFGSPEYMTYVFKQDTNLSPLKYRSQIRGRRTDFLNP